MIYNSDSNNQDIVSATRFYCDAVASDYSINDITRNANIAYHKVASIIAQADGTWQWDDANNTTLPVAVTDLVANQRDYTLNDEMLEIERVEVMDTTGNWRKLVPIDKEQIVGAIDEYQKNAAQPIEYDKIGRTLYLFPASQFAVTGGLKVHLKREANIFTVSDTTKEPGFSDTFHDYIPTYAALVYCELYKPKRVPMLLQRLERMEQDIKRFYGRRSKDVRYRIAADNYYTNV